MSLAGAPTHKIVWVCDVCHQRGQWAEGWSTIGSDLHLHWAPEDLLTTCSPACRRIAVAEVAAGRMGLPVFDLPRGKDHPVMVQQRKGY